MESTAVAGRYTKLAAKREPYITRARHCAQLTIPSLFPPEGSIGSETLYVPYQGIGARGVKHLASKLILALLPPNQPFFRLTVDESEISEGTQGQVDEALAMMENIIVQDLETRQLRVNLHEALKQLLVAGNYLLYFGKDGIRGFRLDKYVVRRDGFGNVLEIIVKEKIAKEDVPKVVLLQQADKMEQDKETFEQFTHIQRKGKGFQVHQEIEGIILPGSQSRYSKETLPWLPLRMIRVDDEDYGRSYVEEHLGDLVSLERLSQALTDGALAAARIIFLLDPASSLRAKTLRDAKNLDIVSGKRDDVMALQLDKYADFRVAKDAINDLSRDLSASFLLNSSVSRQAERVTAEEIRFMASELEQAVGGVYSLLSVELQLPLVHIAMARLARSGQLPSLPKDKVKPQVLTGVQALGRTQELEKLRILQSFLEPYGPEIASKYMEFDEFIRRVSAAVHLDKAGLVPDQETIRKREQQAQAAAMAQSIAPQAAKTITEGE